MKFTLKALEFVLVFGVSLVLLSVTVSAEEPGVEGIARPFMGEEKVTDGEIVSFDGKSMSKSKKEFDPNIHGVVVKDPALAIMDLNKQDTMYVATSGKVLVKVSTEKGAIKANDYITSSRIPGVGVRADKDGVVLGVALEAFNGSGTGYIPVNVRPHFLGTERNDGFFKSKVWPVILLVLVDFLIFR